MDKNQYINKISEEPEDRLLLARIMDKMEQCRRKNIPAATCFLSPREQAMAVALLNSLGVRSGYCMEGGYEGAERRLCVFLPDWTENAGEEIACIRAEFPKQEEAPTHRDLLGSLMGLGITREKLGDILVNPAYADVVAAASLGEYLAENWISAGRTHLSVYPIEPCELTVPEVKTEVRKTTVSTLRLDALVAAIFPVSRSKASDLIRGGKVSLDHMICEKPDRQLGEGSLMSVRGMGRAKLTAVGGETRKGRISVTLEKYI